MIYIQEDHMGHSPRGRELAWVRGWKETCDMGSTTSEYFDATWDIWLASLSPDERAAALVWSSPAAKDHADLLMRKRMSDRQKLLARRNK